MGVEVLRAELLVEDAEVSAEANNAEPEVLKEDSNKKHAEKRFAPKELPEELRHNP